jgi:hypothetical protein
VPGLFKEPSLDAIRKGLASSGRPAAPTPRPAEGNWGCTGFGPYPTVMELAGAIEGWVVAGRLTPGEFTVQYAQSPSHPEGRPEETLFTAIVTWQRSA